MHSTAPDHNPIIPSPPFLPRELPGLTRVQSSHALKRVFALRARLFAFAIALLYAPVLLHVSGPIYAGRTLQLVVLLLAAIMLLRIITLRNIDSHLRKWGHVAIAMYLGLMGLSLFPVQPELAVSSRHVLLLSVLLSGCFLLSARWFVVSTLISGFLYSNLLSQSSPPTEWMELYLEFCTIAVLGGVIQITQAKLAKDYNTVALTDEARFAVYSQAAEAAHKAERRFEMLSNASREALVLHADGRIVDLNNAALEMIGSHRDKLLGKPVTDLLGKDHGRLVSEITDPANSNFTKVTVIRADGIQIDAIGFNHLIMSPDGSVAVLGLRHVERRYRFDARPMTGVTMALRN